MDESAKSNTMEAPTVSATDTAIAPTATETDTESATSDPVVETEDFDTPDTPPKTNKKKATFIVPEKEPKKDFKRSVSNVEQISSSNTLPESIAWRVTQSWELVSGHTEEVGVDFFLRLFKEHPQAMELFRFGGDLDGPVKVPKALKVHAKTVMETVGVCVAGLTHLPDLVPTLRSLGKFHGSLGVQHFHYDAVYKHLMNAIEAHVGPENFDDDTREAWEIVYRSLTQVMKNPDQVLQMEPLEGWGTVATAACAYLTIVTPLQMASLTAGNSMLDFWCNLFTVMATLVLAIDMSSHWIADQVRPKGYAPDLSKRSPLRRTFDRFMFPVKFRAIRFLRRLQMDRWVQWPKMEATVLLSFPLQYAGHFLLGAAGGYGINVGVHWTYALGLLRLVAAARVFHAAACAENNFLLRKRHIDAQELSAIRMTKLIMTMLLVIHINACLWCLVARIELGGGAVETSAFFPKANEIFGSEDGSIKKLSFLNAYLHAVHWAWVNLAGIGDVDSTPETTLECLATLFVHMCGATLYTITTGNVVNILESMSAKRNETGGDLAELGHFMQTCHVPQDIQKRILEGYMMKKMIGDSGGPAGSVDDGRAPESPDAVARLPRHLEAEVLMYYRAEAIRRRDSAFSYCGHEFLVAFVASLTRPKVVLAEEDYVTEGQELPSHVALLVEGRMKVFVDGVCVRLLEAGDLVGKHHLFLDTANWHAEKVGLRAETTCTLMTGLPSRREVEALRKRYQRDFNLLTAYRFGNVPDAMNDVSFVEMSTSGRRSSLTQG